LSYLNFYIYRIIVPNKKENIENLQKKLGEVLGLERAAQKAVDELITMKLLKSDSKTEAKEIQGEASTHEEKIQEVISIFSEDKNVKLDVAKVEESAKETEEKATQIMKTYLGEEPDTSEALEFLCLAEGGEVSHYEVLQAICGNFDNKKALSTVKSILKEEQRHLSQCIEMAKSAVS
jgi:ferritin-like metal-binding protein YciE